MYQRAGIYGGHVIMLSRDEATTRAATDAVAAFPGGLQVGGGVTAETAAPLLDAGASHVIVTSYVFRDGDLDEERLAALVEAVGKERLVLDLSCRRRGDDYFVVTDRWQKWTDLKVDAATMATLADSCDEFLVHGVDVEGMKLGIDEELVRRLGQHSPIPVTYAGAPGPSPTWNSSEARGGQWSTSRWGARSTVSGERYRTTRWWRGTTRRRDSSPREKEPIDEDGVACVLVASRIPPVVFVFARRVSSKVERSLVFSLVLLSFVRLDDA